MGCNISLPESTLSGAAPPGGGQRVTSAELRQVADAMSHPDDVAASRRVEEAAEAAALAMFRANEGRVFRDKYVRATLASYGASCKVFTAAHRHTNEAVAIKTIRKVKQQQGVQQQRRRVLLEVGATHMLQGHPHAVRLYDVYEDANSYHLVMEMLAGGELFDHISAAGALTEAQAANILRSLCLFLAHAHAQGVAHMDIKPENIMFDAGGSAGVLKVIDLGSAEFMQPNQLVARAFGTVRYSSPEMARDICGQRSDVWSAGVVMYQILAGRVPFLKDTDAATLSLLQKGPEVKFSGSRWKNISQDAKDCIRLMLTPDPKMRPTASQVLQHPWLAADAPQTAIDASILHQLQLFASLNKARRLMLGVAAKSLSGVEASEVLRRFLALDKDYNGTLDMKELSEAARQVAPDISEGDLAAMFAALDVDNTGSVDAQEFFAAVLSIHLHPSVNEAVMERSFRSLDRASNGYFTRQDLRTAISLQRPSAFQTGSPGIECELDQEFDAMDANGDGVVTLDEFKTAMRTISLDRSSISSKSGSLAGGSPPAGGSPTGEWRAPPGALAWRSASPPPGLGGPSGLGPPAGAASLQRAASEGAGAPRGSPPRAPAALAHHAAVPPAIGLHAGGAGSPLGQRQRMSAPGRPPKAPHVSAAVPAALQPVDYDLMGSPFGAAAAAPLPAATS